LGDATSAEYLLDKLVRKELVSPDTSVLPSDLNAAQVTQPAAAQRGNTEKSYIITQTLVTGFTTIS
jgi:hypothetical protein